MVVGEAQVQKYLGCVWGLGVRGSVLEKDRRKPPSPPPPPLKSVRLVVLLEVSGRRWVDGR